MRRSVCYCEPNIAFAGETNTWTFVYTSSIDLPKGTKFKFDILSKGRGIDWEVPTTNLKQNACVIFAKLEDGKILQAKAIDSPNCFTPSFEFVLSSKLESGSPLSIVMGSSKGTKNGGITAQALAQRRRSFHLYIDPKGKGYNEEPEVFTLDVKGNKLKTIRVLSPSFVTRNKRFDVIVRFEDEYGNLTNNADPETLIELSYENLRENLNWKLFIPETGFISLPNLYFNEPGVYKIQLLNTQTKERFYSAPIMCFAENAKNLFWGELHGESEKVDSTENIENYLRHFRDDKALNFCAMSPFESQEETPNEIWKLITQNVLEFDEPDRFTAFLGLQWVGAKGQEGIRQIIYTKDGKQILRKKDPKYSSLEKIYKTFSPKEIISIPSFTMGKVYDFDFSKFNPEYERVVEIYNSWGSSECSQKEGNPLPIMAEGKGGIGESIEGSIQKALQKNCRFGFVAGGMDDRGVYSTCYASDQVQYPPGLTAILSQEHTKAAIAEALYNRNCYATTGERIIVGFTLAGLPMGSETTTAVKYGLKVNRHLNGYVAGTAKIAKIEIIRNGKVIKTIDDINAYSTNFTYDDLMPLEKVVIHNKEKKASDSKPPFVYYYIRVTQEDGHMAWSSPIWVDLVEGATVQKAARRPLLKSAKKPLILDLEDDEDDEEEETLDEDDDDYDDA